MGFTTPTLPQVNVDTFLDKPLLERMKILAQSWGENGFGSPRIFHVIYIAKLLFFYALLGTFIASWTSGLGPLSHFSSWWTEPIFYQKLIIWTALLEILGVGGSWGPLAGHFKPMLGGVLYWARVGTIRQPPWPRLPLTGGDSRTPLDVLGYLLLVASLVVALALPGVSNASLSTVLPQVTAGLVNPVLLIPVMVLLVVMGLRDKVLFLAARGEQYLPALIMFTALNYVDMIIGLKLLIVVVWMGAGFSKFGKHFANVVPPMVSNAPSMPFKAIKRAHYRDYPNDLRPSHVAGLLAHIGGTFVEIVTPLILLFSTNLTLTLLAVVLMVLFHAFIASTFPLAVPLEWNVLFGFATVFLFWGHPAWAGYGIGNMSSVWLTVVIVAALLFFPVLGNLRPDLVSFLPSMRQYAGNWASATWAFAPGAEAKLDAITRPAGNQLDQLIALGTPPKVAELLLQTTVAWRSMHSQGRALLSLLITHVPDIDQYTLREAEFACNSVIGWNFGDGHLHNEQLIAAIQARCGFRPGEFIIAWVESQAIQRDTQAYKVIDAALGVIERGTFRPADAVAEQPWLPNGPIPFHVEWSRGTGLKATT